MSETTVVIGLGNLGNAIATRLLRLGHEVIGVEADEPCRQAWLRQTGHEAHAELTTVPWAQPSRVIVLVRMTDQVRQCLDLLTEFLGSRTDPPAVHLMTTLEPNFARGLIDHNGSGIRVLEQPVSGGAVGARAGTLTVLSAGRMVPGDRSFLQATIAGTIIDFDNYGQPTLAKLINNAAAAYHTRTAALLLAVAHHGGLSPQQMMSVWRSSSGGSPMTSALPDLDVLQAQLLTKDAALLQAFVGRLPTISIDNEDDFMVDLVLAQHLFPDKEPRAISRTTDRSTIEDK